MGEDGVMESMSEWESSMGLGDEAREGVFWREDNAGEGRVLFE